jgi:hypothetical protein
MKNNRMVSTVFLLSFALQSCYMSTRKNVLQEAPEMEGCDMTEQAIDVWSEGMGSLSEQELSTRYCDSYRPVDEAVADFNATLPGGIHHLTAEEFKCNLANDELMEEVVDYATDGNIFVFLFCEVQPPEFRIMLVELNRLMAENLVCDRITLGYYGDDMIRLEWDFGTFHSEELGEFSCGYNLCVRN